MALATLQVCSMTIGRKTKDKTAKSTNGVKPRRNTKPGSQKVKSKGKRKYFEDFFKIV